IDRAEERLEGIGQDGLAPEAARLELARAEPQLLAQVDLRGDDRERLTAHEARAESRQVAFVGRSELAEDQDRDDAVEHCIAEEFQALVVRTAGAAMRERGF